VIFLKLQNRFIIGEYKEDLESHLLAIEDNINKTNFLKEEKIW